MRKLIETTLIWGALPYLALAALGITMKWPLIVLGGIAAVVGLPILAGFIYGLFQGFSEVATDRERERQQQARAASSAFAPLGVDDVSPPAAPRALAPPKPAPAALPVLGNQWRA